MPEILKSKGDKRIIIEAILKGISIYPTSLKSIISKNQTQKDKIIQGIENEIMN